MISSTEENYLKTLLHLEEKTGEATANDLSKLLNIKMSTVNSMMKKLAEKGFVHYESYKPVTLTDTGKKQAALILRKHRLVEMYLVEKMGFGWEQVHAIAEQIEHIQSPVFFEKIDELLNHPTADPHGSPIPDKDGNIKPTNFLKLSNCCEGEQVRFSAVIDSNAEFLQFLTKRNLTLGVIIKIITIEIFDGSMTVSYNGNKNEVLSRIVCDKLLVTK
ncbi:metal-dependent transcriptional regulator [Dysgonomonas macrotermitis]|uniref:Transcriptional regulator MntR n=1 Tax=Dysgonomonas macrotermitis TaxID=1346286 RepID=A0A1M5FPN5_9BACT|nr:metal-dependent transcriptional regulator [Dysgonomonas macrotermitis]SHF93131.1 iron (metal) dependent repressor, DtxR family [Dysgonomonas macrotermitis]